MKRLLLCTSRTVICVVLFTYGALDALAAPVVSNVRAVQRAGTQLVDIQYNLSAIGPCTITILVSADGGTNYNVPAFTFTGAVGPGVTPGNDRAIVWNAGVDWAGRFTSACRVRVIADDGSGSAAPPGMALIPGGSFQMGDNLDGFAGAQPVHTVSLSPFFMDKLEVGQELWDQVRQWATNHGYTDLPASAGQGVHPVDAASWYSAVKWCNARSEMEQLIPVYYTEAALTNVYRTGSIALGNDYVRWGANGYRLPTEAEWEMAARGGTNGLRYPWGNTISNFQANFFNSGDPFEGQFQGTTPVGYYSGNQSPPGPDMANGYGLYDVVGNVGEWCWDRYGSYPALPQSNPLGPSSGGNRVYRGGAFISGCNSTTSELHCAYRQGRNPSSIITVNCTIDYDMSGFRCARSFGP